MPLQETVRQRVRTRAAIGAAFVALLVAACTPAPGTIPFEGGTFDIDVTVPSQSFDVDFLICTTTATTDPIDLVGATLTVPSVDVDPTLSIISVPSSTLTIPAGTLAAGSLSIECFGETFGPVTIDLSLAGSVSTEAASLDTATQTISLDDATLLLDGAEVIVPGIGSIPLPPFEVELGAISVDY